MNLNDCIQLLLIQEAKAALKQEPGEATHKFERRIENYVNKRTAQLARVLVGEMP